MFSESGVYQIKKVLNVFKSKDEKIEVTKDKVIVRENAGVSYRYNRKCHNCNYEFRPEEVLELDYCPGCGVPIRPPSQYFCEGW